MIEILWPFEKLYADPGESDLSIGDYVGGRVILTVHEFESILPQRGGSGCEDGSVHLYGKHL